MPSTLVGARKYTTAFIERLRSPAMASVMHRGLWGLADQGLLSLATFVMFAIIARASSLRDFGLFSLAVTFINIEMVLASALLTSPFVVIGASYERDRLKAYLSLIYILQVALGLVVSFGLLIAAVVVSVLDWGDYGLILMIVPAMVAWQLQDFIRQPLYVEGRVKGVLINDLVSYGGQIAAMGIAYYWGVLTYSSALGIIAATSGLAVLLGFVQLRGLLTNRVSKTDAWEFVGETWRFGRWTLGSTFLLTASAQMVLFILAGFRGPSAAGELRASVAIMGPGRVILRGIQTAFMPLAASTLAREGKPGLRSLLKRMVLFSGPLTVAYGLLVSLKPTALVTFVFGAEYAASATWLLPLIGLGYVLLVLVAPLDIGLRALRVTSPHFRAGVLTFIAFWTISMPAIYFFGLLGAVFSTLLTPLIAGAEFWRHYRREMQET